jgi:hypothetical protein
MDNLPAQAATAIIALIICCSSDILPQSLPSSARPATNIPERRRKNEQQKTFSLRLLLLLLMPLARVDFKNWH